MQRTAGIIIDYQNDFVSPSGELYVQGAEKLLPVIKNFIDECKEKSRQIIATKDRHPKNHVSFASTHNVAPFTHHLDDVKRPDHCVQGTRGGELYQLDENDFTHIVLKADRVDQDAYSGFLGTDLHDYLQQHHIDHIIIAGVATDYCVMSTVRDALELGYKVDVLSYGIAGVDPKKSQEIQQQRGKQGVGVV